MTNTTRHPRHAAFTLIELLVVIGIIVLLIAILLPALGIARRQAYETRSRTQLEGIRAGIEQYHGLFGSYPGPVRETAIAKEPTMFSGAQNLVLGLSQRWTPSGPGTAVSVDGNNLSVDASATATPIDNSNDKPYSPFFSPKNSEVRNASAFVTGLPDTPVYVDQFTDALPILYYRKTKGVDKHADGKLVKADGSGGVAPFYHNANQAFTSGEVKSTTGRAFMQDFTLTELENVVKNSATGTPIGGFVLISAGSDRLFGPDSKNKNDDIIISGGQ